MLYTLQNLNLNLNLPDNIINLIFTYLSTPSADIIKNAYKYIYSKVEYKQINNNIEIDDTESYKQFALDYFHIIKRNFEKVTKTILYKNNTKYCIYYKFLYYPNKINILNFTYNYFFFSSIELFFLYMSFWLFIDNNIEIDNDNNTEIDNGTNTEIDNGTNTEIDNDNNTEIENNTEINNIKEIEFYEYIKYT